ncbi:sugar ABC transporter permease [Acidisoma cellulosilytica]|uniref:Sugar ABC transporter permease n=1 Tax=Acidisoma cellulosilyticum TaxID=2802395 RepID=A0A963Z248_9PROT|nr:sugar ABC transporter permease [Acidisoma cellulosilyticum]MCB8881111.1 sugar ABC transporter permease [Acidisoma cellulosilyticum]
MSAAGRTIAFGQERRAGYWLLAPLIAFLVITLGFPLATDLVYSVSTVSFTALWSPHWRGLGNFVDVLQDPVFWQAAGFSLRFAVIATVAEVALGFALVLILNPLLERHGWLIAFLILPMMISPALIGIMYRLMLNDFVGIIPQYLDMIGIDANLLGPQCVFGTLVVIEVLQWTPFALLALLAAYQAIPAELVEAARIDGGGSLSVFRFVTWPLMLPALGITAFIRFIDSFRVFDQIYVLTGGGPGTMTTSMSLYIYRAFFEKQQIGLAVAASLLLLVAAVLLLRVSLTRLLRNEPA